MLRDFSELRPLASTKVGAFKQAVVVSELVHHLRHADLERVPRDIVKGFGRFPDAYRTIRNAGANPNDRQFLIYDYADAAVYTREAESRPRRNTVVGMARIAVGREVVDTQGNVYRGNLVDYWLSGLHNILRPSIEATVGGIAAANYRLTLQEAIRAEASGTTYLMSLGRETADLAFYMREHPGYRAIPASPAMLETMGIAEPWSSTADTIHLVPSDVVSPFIPNI